ncbi:hypothetical protein BGX27_003057 [Mortierella sp. AM989]|nr:hypothetical protein BGX27_003057 [Mortierella sp. AM989]
MQFKSLIIALAAVAASVSAQSFQDTPCSRCILDSLVNEPTCKSLAPAEMKQLNNAFANHTVNLPELATAVQSVGIKNCLCKWSVAPLSATGAAASCIAPQGTTPANCSAAEVTEGTTKLAPFPIIIGCESANKTANGTTPNPATTSPNGAGASFLLNLPFVAVIAVVGAAVVGL